LEAFSDGVIAILITIMEVAPSELECYLFASALATLSASAHPFKGIHAPK
jgi:uncharacterized membrane protein